MKCESGPDRVVEITERVVAFLLGAIAGSFLNVCVARWPAGLSVVKPRSRCPRCETPIAAYDNIPIVSWLALRGRCRSCGALISPAYPLVELFIAGVWLGAVMAFGVSFTALQIAVFITVLTGIALTDARHYLIPDGFTVFGLIWSLVASLIAWWLPGPSPFAGPWGAVIGACTGAGVVAITGWLGEAVLKKEAMGFGDVTLMAVVGAALGAERALLTLFLGAALGVVVLLALAPFGLSKSIARATAADVTDGEAAVANASDRSSGLRGRQIPFGVFLVPASLISLFWGDGLIAWYLNLARYGLGS